MDKAPLLHWFPSRADMPPEMAYRFARSNNTCPRAVGPPTGKEGQRPRGWMATPFDGCLPEYIPGEQRWEEVAVGHWVGVRLDLKPETLARDETFGGYPVTLGDGNSWVVPVANPFVSTCCLPRSEYLVRGEWVEDVQDRFRDLSERAAGFASELRSAFLDGKTTFAISDGDLRALVADVLALNYNVTLEELSVMRVFSSETNWPAIRAFLDWAEMEHAMLRDIAAVADPDSPETAALAEAAGGKGPFGV